jgi:hypothetical protein
MRWLSLAATAIAGVGIGSVGYLNGLSDGRAESNACERERNTCAVRLQEYIETREMLRDGYRRCSIEVAELKERTKP